MATETITIAKNVGTLIGIPKMIQLSKAVKANSKALAKTLTIELRCFKNTLVTTPIIDKYK